MNFASYLQVMFQVDAGDKGSKLSYDKLFILKW